MAYSSAGLLRINLSTREGCIFSWEQRPRFALGWGSKESCRQGHSVFGEVHPGPRWVCRDKEESLVEIDEVIPIKARDPFL